MDPTLGESFYEAQGDRFVSTNHTIGPWDRRFQHAGPGSALLCRSVEKLAGVEWSVRRFTIDLLRPIPVGALRIECRAIGAGRTVRRFEAELHAGEKVVARMRALALVRRELVLEAPGRTPHGVAAPDELGSTTFDFFAPGPGYHEAMEVRVARGRWQAGPSWMWLRMRIPLVAGEEPSPQQRALCAADSGNGISICLPLDDWTFVNADLTVALHHEPRGEWIGLDARTDAAADGVAVASTSLFDVDAAVGTGSQTLVIAPR